MHYGDIELAKAIMAERMAEAERYRRTAGRRRSRAARPRGPRLFRLSSRVHAPRVFRHRPV